VSLPCCAVRGGSAAGVERGTPSLQGIELELMRAGVPPERHLPAWTARTARPAWGPAVAWDRLKQLPAKEAGEQAEAQAVTEAYAKKVRAALLEVAQVAQRMIPDGGIEEVALQYLVEVVQRERVQRVTTLQWHWRVVLGAWPSLRGSARIASLMRGLAMANPIAPERAGVVIEREWDAEAVRVACAGLLMSGERLNQLTVQAVVNVLAGGRLAETVRSMTAGTNAWTVDASPGGDAVIVWIAQDGMKDDLVGAQFHPRPKAVRIPRTWLSVGPTKLRIVKGEEETVHRQASEVIRRSGRVSTVTAARRSIAASSWKVSAATGATDAEALATVRDVLGHVDGSTSTARYLPERLGMRARERVRQAALARP
jgi:hypothetical protein